MENEKLNADMAAQIAEYESKISELKNKADEMEAQNAKFIEEAKEKETQHENTLKANKRLSEDKAAKKEEVSELQERIDGYESQIEKINQFMSNIEKEAKEAEFAAKEDLIKKELKNSGFTSESLLVKEFDINEVEIKDGVIVGYEEKIKDLKEKHPSLYIDTSAGLSQTEKVVLKQETAITEKLQDITKKVEEGKDLTSTELALAMFGK